MPLSSHAYTETGYLPENFLPEFLDLVIWGHEHECLIEPRYNPEMSFHVMQPGSSVATSLMPGEAVPKHVAILSITGKEFKSEPILLKEVRPFVMREIVLQDDRHMRAIAKKDDNRPEITRHLIAIVDDMIKEAKQGWRDQHEGDDEDEVEKCPLPLIRLRVEYTSPEGGRFDCENPQRFSNRFVGRVANVNDVVQFHRKKVSAARKTKEQPDMPEESIMAQLSIDSVKVEKLVREFLTAQSLTILPQNSFGDAVSQFVDKDDKHAMETFVNESLGGQVKHLLTINGAHDEDEITGAMEDYKAKLEELFTQGHLKRSKKSKKKPKPTNWDSDLNGAWSDDAAAVLRNSDGEVVSEEEEDDSLGSIVLKTTATRGKGKSAASSSRRMTAAMKKAAPAKRTAARSKRKQPSEDEDEEDDDDVIMIDDDDDEEEEEDDDALFVKQTTKKVSAKAAPKRAASPKRKVPARSTAPKSTARKQSTLNFSQPSAAPQPRQAAAASARSRRVQEPVGVLRSKISTLTDKYDRVMMRSPMTTMRLSLLHQLRVRQELASRADPSFALHFCGVGA